jgi:phage terminase small subunit
MDKLKPLEEAFAEATLKHATITDAYKAVANVSHWKPSTINRVAKAMFNDERVYARIVELRNEAAKDTVMEAAEVLRDLVDIHKADPNELIQYRRVNCRHCHGVDFAYQWVNPREFQQKIDKLRNMAASVRRRQVEPTDEGGYGFHSQREPNPDCPMCGGMGVGSVWLADTRFLSPRAKKLYAGVKVGKDGQIEVKMRDQDLALTHIARFRGMLRGDNPIVNITQNNNTQVNNNVPSVKDIPNDPMQIETYYRDIMGNGQK